MSAEAIDKTAIRDAATVIMVRQGGGGPEILMGQRGAKASFMPNKFVFPGGAVDAEDRFSSGLEMGDELREKLGAQAGQDMPEALVHAAIREVWEETGLILGVKDEASLAAVVPENWAGFYAAGYVPRATGMRFIFRAITPPGRPRRFDARFIMVNAELIDSDPDDFSGASGELSHLQWIALAEVQKFELAFITEIVLAELEAILKAPDETRPIPFFHNKDERAQFGVL